MQYMQSSIKTYIYFLRRLSNDHNKYISNVRLSMPYIFLKSTIYMDVIVISITKSNLMSNLTKL